MEWREEEVAKMQLVGLIDLYVSQLAFHVHMKKMICYDRCYEPTLPISDFNVKQSNKNIKSNVRAMKKRESPSQSCMRCYTAQGILMVNKGMWGHLPSTSAWNILNKWSKHTHNQRLGLPNFVLLMLVSTNQYTFKPVCFFFFCHRLSYWFYAWACRVITKQIAQTWIWQSLYEECFIDFWMVALFGSFTGEKGRLLIGETHSAAYSHCLIALLYSLWQLMQQAPCQRVKS